jgi:hypothetical protein
MKLAKDYPIRLVCRLLDVPRSSVYYAAPATARREAMLKTVLLDLAGQWPTYGYRRPHQDDAPPRLSVNSKRVRRWMDELQLTGTPPKRTTRTHQQQPCLPAFSQPRQRSGNFHAGSASAPHDGRDITEGAFLADLVASPPKLWVQRSRPPRHHRVCPARLVQRPKWISQMKWAAGKGWTLIVWPRSSPECLDDFVVFNRDRQSTERWRSHLPRTTRRTLEALRAPSCVSNGPRFASALLHAYRRDTPHSPPFRNVFSSSAQPTCPQPATSHTTASTIISPSSPSLLLPPNIFA